MVAYEIWCWGNIRLVDLLHNVTTPTSKLARMELCSKTTANALKGLRFSMRPREMLIELTACIVLAKSIRLDPIGNYCK